jgi:hypothetical protein
MFASPKFSKTIIYIVFRDFLKENSVPLFDPLRYRAGEQEIQPQTTQYKNTNSQDREQSDHPMQKSSCTFLITVFCILLLLTAGCMETAQSPPVTSSPVMTKTTVLTPTPVKEIIYVYVTVTVTPPPPTPVPTPTKDKVASSDLLAYNAWRYQTVSKDDGSFRYGPVTALLIHLNKAPDEQSYQLYYEGGRQWKEELERLIDTVRTTAPAVRSGDMRAAISNYTVNLITQNETIRTLDRVMTNWEFFEAGKVTNGIVLNITNATQRMDNEIILLT